MKYRKMSASKSVLHMFVSKQNKKAQQQKNPTKSVFLISPADLVPSYAYTGQYLKERKLQ